MANDINVVNTEEERQQRWDICNQCEYKVPDEQVMAKCSQCDCPVNYLATFKFKTCPINKW